MIKPICVTLEVWIKRKRPGREGLLEKLWSGTSPGVIQS
jgi:hypothetical protein